MAFIDAYNASQSTSLNQRVRVAMMQYAAVVASEATTTTNHTARAALIPNAMASVPSYANLFTVAVTAIAGITENSTDAEILTAVGSAWSTFAGVI